MVTFLKAGDNSFCITKYKTTFLLKVYLTRGKQTFIWHLTSRQKNKYILSFFFWQSKDMSYKSDIWNNPKTSIRIISTKLAKLTAVCRLKTLGFTVSLEIIYIYCYFKNFTFYIFWAYKNGFTRFHNLVVHFFILIFFDF